MSQQPIETEVVLTTDNSQYDRSMQQSAAVTDTLISSVDTLSGKLSQLSKSAGRKMLGVSAADVATITGLTVAYGAYEKQLTGLNAQAAILSKTYAEGDKLARTYAASVNTLRGNFGTATSEAAQLVQTITRMSDGTAGIDKLSTTFTKMANATQESATGLAGSVLQLQRTMGTPQRDTEKYANSLATLAMHTNSSATAIADFAQQIAPVGRLVGQSQEDIQGVSAAFLKAGQDGYRAATVYNKVLTDIAYATQSGSPELAKYANFVGMTVDSFKGLSGTDKILSFFEQVNRLGPDAITALNRMGLDGANTVKAISAVTQQSGGLGASIQQSRAAMNDNAIGRGNEAAMKGLTDDIAKLRSELNMTAESMGSRFAPAASDMLKMLTSLARAGHALADSPLGNLGAMVMGQVAPLAAAAGALGLVAPLMAKLGTGALLWRGAGTRGFAEGLRGAPTVTANVSKFNQGEVGGMIATNGSWFQRYQYNAFNRLGAGAGAAMSLPFFGTQSRGPIAPRLGAAALNTTAFGIRNLLTPLYSPLTRSGYADPTQRARLFNDSRNPLRQGVDAFRERFTGRSMTTSLGQASVDRGVSLFDRDVRVTEEGRVTSAAARAAVTREAGLMSAAFANVTRATGTFAGALASATVNTAYLGGKGVAKVAGAVTNNSMLAGLGLMLGGSALGINNNALTLGSMGLMMGGPAIGAGAALAGFGFDTFQQYKDSKNIHQNFMESMKSDSLAERVAGSNAAISEGQRVSAVYDGALSKSPGQLFGRAKMEIAGAFSGNGPNDPNDPVTRAYNDARLAEHKNVTTAQALFSIGMKQGIDTGKVTFTSDGKGVDATSWENLNKVLTAVTPQMEKLNLTIDDVAEAWAKGPNSEDWHKMLDQLANPDAYNGIQMRIGRTSPAAAQFAFGYSVDQAVRHPADMNAQYQAVNETYAEMGAENGNVASIIRRMGNVRAAAGDDSDPYYQLAQGVQSQALREQSYRLPFMSRANQFQVAAQNFSAQRSVMAGDPHQAENMQAAEDSFMQSANAQGEYFRSLLMQQREFEISQKRAQEDFGTTQERMEYQYDLSRERAQDDYNTQRKYQEADYQLSRRRSEHDFAISRERSQEAYTRSLKRSQFDFNLSRKRQEQDFAHQQTLMVEQNAKSMYSIYDRVRVQSTSSANYLLFNGRDQLQRMQEQEANLARLRKSGVSDDVIQQLGLTDAANAQQLARFVAEVANNPEMVDAFNKQIKKRLKAAAALTKDESSADWQEFLRQYRIARQRGSEDFQRQVQRSHRDFRIQMSQMEEDFHKSMNRQAQDYETSQTRQQAQFSKSMKRSAEDYATAVDQMTDDFSKSMDRAKNDMNRMAKEISGDLETILVKATKKLGGTAAAQAKVILDALRNLDTDIGTTGVQLMTHAAQVFGFKYKNPGKANYNSDDHVFTPHGLAAGGVLPGPRSVGSDNMVFRSEQHGELHLAGGEAVMVPEWVDAVGGPAAVARMNKAARNKQHYWMGGVLPLPGATSISQHHDPIYASDIWAGDLNWPGRADYGKPIVAYKSGIARPFDYGKDDSYGRGVMLEQKDGHDSLYAHMSAIVKGIAGKLVTAGQTIGYVGDYGNTGNPPTSHLHFELRDHGWNLPFVGNDGLTGAPGGAGGSSTVAGILAQVLRPRYSKVERDAAKVTAGGGMFEDGFWSDKINKWATRAIRQGVKASGGSTHLGGPLEQYVPGHDSGGSNQQIVRNAMRSFGWHQWPSLYQLVMHESGFNNTAQNPTSTAYGMFQFLDSTWAGVGGHKTSDPTLQALYGMRYIKNRYQDPKGAWDFWQNHHWYGDGGIVSGAQTIGVGERGPEMVLPLNGTGANFIADLFRKTQVGVEAKQTNVRASHTPVGNTYTTYQIDRSTTFSGNITVQANDPNEMITKLKARQRVQAMAQASLGGVR